MESGYVLNDSLKERERFTWVEDEIKVEKTGERKLIGNVYSYGLGKELVRYKSMNMAREWEQGSCFKGIQLRDVKASTEQVIVYWHAGNAGLRRAAWNE